MSQWAWATAPAPAQAQAPNPGWLVQTRAYSRHAHSMSSQILLLTSYGKSSEQAMTKAAATADARNRWCTEVCCQRAISEPAVGNSHAAQELAPAPAEAAWRLQPCAPV